MQEPGTKANNLSNQQRRRWMGLSQERAGKQVWSENGGGGMQKAKERHMNSGMWPGIRDRVALFLSNAGVNLCPGEGALVETAYSVGKQGTWEGNSYHSSAVQHLGCLRESLDSP